MFDLQEIAAITGGRLLSEQAASVRPKRFVHDSRLVETGDLFVALSGEHTDGHAFIVDAFERGASAALVAEPGEAPSGTSNHVVVPDVLCALQAVACAWRTRLSGTFIAITGSNGKTTTRALLAHLLGSLPEAYEAPKNFNTEIGLPLAILAMPETARVGVFELGADRPGDIGKLAEILCPDLGIITSVGPSHLDRFDSVERVAAEKASLAEALPDNGLLLVNADSEPLAQLLDEASSPCRLVRAGLDRGDIVAKVECSVPRIELVVDRPTLRLTAPLLGRHSARNLLLAALAALELGVPRETIAQRATSFIPVDHRLQELDAPFGTILDDTYNANPASTKEALRVLAGFGSASALRAFVFGDMRDLGLISDAEHRHMAEFALGLGIDRIFPVGDLASSACRATAPAVSRFVRRPELARAIVEEARGETVVLVKGSRTLTLEDLVAELRAAAT